MSEGFDLSGAWAGIYSYPRLLPPNRFEAVLQDIAGALTGEISERGQIGRVKGQVIYAFLEGARLGSNVSFVKFYDEVSRYRHAVHYSGRVNATGDEISGTWVIPGNWSGTFLMIRPARETATARKEATDTVR